MEKKCKNCKSYEPMLYMGNCKTLSKIGKEKGEIKEDKVYDLKNPKQGDIMASASGIGVGENYSCERFETK